jgi:hypothetical protein
MTALLSLSLLLFGLRLWATSFVGFGDSEALYASWAVHPQPAYLDHPGLIGIVARAIGEGASPSPARAHFVTTVIATSMPWLFVATARALGAPRERALRMGLVVAVVPELAVGLFALTPDLVLAPLWLGAIALAAIALRGPRGSTGSAAAFVGAGLAAGVAASAKVSGLLLVAALASAYLAIGRSRTPSAAVVRTPWPWAGIAVGLVTIVPIVLYEARSGMPMLRHRFVDTQTGAGLAAANVGALVGGQLVYLSPVLAWTAAALGRYLVRARNDDATTLLLFWCFALPIAPLVLLCLWSRVAEPHWIAPALLALPLYGACADALPKATVRAVRWGAALAALVTLAAHLWVLLPASARLVPEGADPKLDIANELYGWPTAVEAVRDEMKLAATPADPEGREVVVVGPHWTICAQLHAAMPDVRVGCATPIRDDFDGWVPRDEWRRAADVLWVTDNRYAADGTDQLPTHVRVSEGKVRTFRGGRSVRLFSLYLYSRRGAARKDRAVHGDALAEQEQ